MRRVLMFPAGLRGSGWTVVYLSLLVGGPLAPRGGPSCQYRRNGIGDERRLLSFAISGVAKWGL